jgi:hypothetical protein
VLLVAGFIAVAFNGGEAISSSNPFFMLYILGVSFFFLWLVLDAWRANLRDACLESIFSE